MYNVIIIACLIILLFIVWLVNAIMITKPKCKKQHLLKKFELKLSAQLYAYVMFFLFNVLNL